MTDQTENSPRRSRRIVVAGASGLIGRALVGALERDGDEIWQLVRRAPAAAREIPWNPAAGEVEPAALEGMDAVVNLSGENVGAGRWSRARREAILQSRVDATRTLVLALQRLRTKPGVWVNASAVGYYGERGDEVVDERSPMGHGFLPEVCLAWETHAEGAARAGVRTVYLRLGVVLAPAGGALAKMLPIFRAGLGGRVGTGRQWMSWISLPDVVGAIRHALADPRCSGPLNLVAPEPVTNADFTIALGRALSRPAVLPVPVVVLRAVFGRMADETLLASTRAVPRALEAAGYGFRHRTVDEALRHALGGG